MSKVINDTEALGAGNAVVNNYEIAYSYSEVMNNIKEYIEDELDCPDYVYSNLKVRSGEFNDTIEINCGCYQIVIGMEPKVFEVSVKDHCCLGGRDIDLIADIRNNVEDITALYNHKAF